MRLTSIVPNDNNVAMNGGKKKPCNRPAFTNELIEKANEACIRCNFPWPIMKTGHYLQSDVTPDGDIFMLVTAPFKGKVVSKLKLTHEQINEAFRKACEAK